LYLCTIVIGYHFFILISMKKFLSILIAVALTVTAIALTSSCKKDIDNAKSLINTTWICNTGEFTYTLTFTSSTAFKVTCEAVGREFPTYTGVFILAGGKAGTLAGSTITLTPDTKWWEEEKETAVGEFKSDNEVVIETLVFKRALK